MTAALVKIMEAQKDQVSSLHSEHSFPRLFRGGTVQIISKGYAMAPSYDQVSVVCECVFPHWNMLFGSSPDGVFIWDTSSLVRTKNRVLFHFPHKELWEIIHTTTIGFSSEVDQELITADRLDEWQKYVIVILDEMHIKEDLVYEKHSGEFIGFANLGTT